MKLDPLPWAQDDTAWETSLCLGRSKFMIDKSLKRDTRMGPSSYPSGSYSSRSTPSRNWGRLLKRLLIALLLIPVLLIGLYLLIVLNWSYSDGERAGYLQKFSRRGWICKTYEGEIAMTTVPGVAPLIWSFSVWDETTAKKITGLLGKKVVVHYREYRGLPTDCFGATEYFVDAVTLAE
jgi:hypothetical protein